MFTSASGRCSGLTVPSARGMPWSNIIMSCWIMPSHLGSGYFFDPAGDSFPCSAWRCSTYARAPLRPVSSLFQRMKRIDRSVWTSGLLNTRASSITIAEPEPSSFAASPQPWPSMCPPTMYISSGRVVPTFVQYTSSRGPGVVGSAFSARSRGSGWASESVLTPVRPRFPRRRLPPGPCVLRAAAARRAAMAALSCGCGAR